MPDQIPSLSPGFAKAAGFFNKLLTEFSARANQTVADVVANSELQ